MLFNQGLNGWVVKIRMNILNAQKTDEKQVMNSIVKCVEKKNQGC